MSCRRPPSPRRPRPAVDPISFRLSEAEAHRVQRSIDGYALVPTVPMAPMPYGPGPYAPSDPRPFQGGGELAPPPRATRPPTALEELQRDLRAQREDDEPPPLEEDPSAAEGGATCKVRFAPGLVVKECPTGDVRTEYELTQRAEAVLGDARVVDMELSDDGTTLSIERLAGGVAFQKAGGDRPFWTGEDSPKVGQLRNFTPEAKAKLRADVAFLHASGIAHNDIHAGNIGIVSTNAAGEVTDAILIDYSEAVDLARLGDVPTTLRKVARGWNTSADWKTPYVERLMERGVDTAEGLFEAAKTYDLNRLAAMGV